MDAEYPATGKENAPLSGGSGEGRRAGDLAARVAVAVPAAAVTILATLQGGLLLAVALAGVGAGAVLELYRLMRVEAPAGAAGAAAVLALPPAALYGGASAMMLVLVAALPVTFALAVRRPSGAPYSVAVTVLGVAWVGLPLAHGVLLRELPEGAELLLGVLVGTFLGDTAAHLVGSAVGRTPIAPRLSPAKTLEGLLAGIVGGAASLWLFMTVTDAPLQGVDALVLGLAVAVAAPVGDLFESLFKRDAAVKDTGRAFGAHGGVLDRLDAVLFTAVVGYYVARALL